MPVYRPNNYVPLLIRMQSISDSRENLENENISEQFSGTGDYTANANLTNNLPQLNIGEKLVETIPDGDLEYEVYFSNPLDGEETSDEIKCSHNQCRIVVKFRRGWPQSYKCLRFYQFCKLDHKIIYGNENGKILHRWMFYQDLTGYVLDRPDPRLSDEKLKNKKQSKPVAESQSKSVAESRSKPVAKSQSKSVAESRSKGDPDNHSYAEIVKDKYDEWKKKDKTVYFQFIDRPSGTWFCKYDEIKQSFDLEKIVKKQDFVLYLVGVTEEGETKVKKCWKWGFDFEYNHIEKSHKHISNKPVVVKNDESLNDASSDALLKHNTVPFELCKLPNANYGMIRFQFKNESLGVLDKVIEMPKDCRNVNDKKEKKRIITEINGLPFGTLDLSTD